MAVTSGLGTKKELSEYKCDANEAVKLKLVKSPKDLNDASTTFAPVMSHQIFGSSESIFGYKGLKVELFYAASTLNTYVNIKCEEQLISAEHDGVQADDILRSLAKYIPPGFITNRDLFIDSLLKEYSFKPFGELMHSYTRNQDGTNQCFEIYKNSVDAPGFRDYHKRLQPFLLWYVDAASFIDVDDERWTFYLIYEKTVDDDGRTRYLIVGYQTVYAYYAYPDYIRPRISQVLVLPPYQRQGHGGELLLTFYRECWCNEKILDITVEDPSEDYQRLRDYVDVKNCLALDAFTVENLKNGFKTSLVKEVQQKLKINRKQCRRIYEIIKFKQTTPETLKAYRLEVKKRLNQPFQQSKKEISRMRTALDESEFEASNALTVEQKHQYLESAYQEHVDQYRHILERLASS